MTRLRRIALAIKSEDYSRRTPIPDSIRAHVADELDESASLSSAGGAEAIVLADDGGLEREAPMGRAALLGSELRARGA
jgi:hypothetical protein